MNIFENFLRRVAARDGAFAGKVYDPAVRRTKERARPTYKDKKPAVKRICPGLPAVCKRAPGK